MKKFVGIFVCFVLLSLLSASVLVTSAQDGPAEAEPGQEVDMILLPKFVGIIVFDQANEGAQEAHAELENPGELTFTGPTPENSIAGQIEIMTNAVTQDVDAVMLSNNSGDQIVPSAVAAQEAGISVVTWDSPIPSAEGESLFVAQVDFGEMGATLAEMSLSILGEDGGQFAILSATPDAANQNAWIEAMMTELEDEKYANLEFTEIVYGNDQSEDSYNQALGLIDKYPDLELIVAPTSVGAPAAAKALQDEGLCGEGTDNSVVVTALAVPAEMLSYTLNGCAPQFALWSFVDLGYTTYYVSYLLETGAITGEVGESFIAGRMGEYTIEEDPTRPDVGAKRIVMGPFTIYDETNVEEAAGEPAVEETPEATEEATGFNIIRQYFGV